ncbi:MULTISPECIES: LuxR family transcriptional regulator [unclassified Burkholderia]|uniref:LuxR family transcriptional regulator n=1 Tax=unclassified Burkholderia TaxID=2613784 RepID=UPI0021502465|nr:MULTISPECIES: helix-turn-helix transcriptional regulator [unclassified Burkholderia]MCR4469863.1 helix-turn-helix transcriptional regulator [Burkholderia sp. SCN-KJ]
MPLTPREAEVLELLRRGLSNSEIAARLGIGLGTSRRHVSRAMLKAGTTSTGVPFLGVPAPSGWIARLGLASLGLSPAEIRVLELLCLGGSSKCIARVIGISPRTVDKHRERLRQKMGFSSTRTLVAWVASQYAKCGID